MILAIDPGREKCGVVVMDKNFDIKFQRVIETSTLESKILELSNSLELHAIILGDGTTSSAAKQLISATLPGIPIKVVDERHTTEEARKLYWKKNPPCGWRKLLPTSMQVPPVPVDDLVAEILAQRFLKNEE